jgi:hypothetical protein
MKLKLKRMEDQVMGGADDVRFPALRDAGC